LTQTYPACCLKNLLTSTNSAKNNGFIELFLSIKKRRYVGIKSTKSMHSDIVKSQIHSVILIVVE